MSKAFVGRKFLVFRYWQNVFSACSASSGNVSVVESDNTGSIIWSWTAADLIVHSEQTLSNRTALCFKME